MLSDMERKPSRGLDGDGSSCAALSWLLDAPPRVSLPGDQLCCRATDENVCGGRRPKPVADGGLPIADAGGLRWPGAGILKGEPTSQSG